MLPEEPDVCVLVGDILELNCMESGSTGTPINVTFFEDNSIVEESIGVTEGLDNTVFQCSVPSEGPCSLPVNFTVRVFGKKFSSPPASFSIPSLFIVEIVTCTSLFVLLGVLKSQGVYDF